MKNIKLYVLTIFTLILLVSFTFASQSDSVSLPQNSSSIDNNTVSTRIYLYGESHGNAKILSKELELWDNYYHKQNMRHLFVEYPYYTAEFLNLWMKEDNDKILDFVFNSWKGTASYTPDVYSFMKKLKEQCPDTVFHGTDVGHQYNSVGKAYLNYLEKNNLKDSKEYNLTKEIIQQGQYFYKNKDDLYRENKMAENFIREFDLLKGNSIMGIYGAAHVGISDLNYRNSGPSMANQLNKHYKDMIVSENLVSLTKLTNPIKTESIILNNKSYKALYFGKQNLPNFPEYEYREFWRIESSYDDFKNNEKTGDVLPFSDYPIIVEKHQVFIIDYKKVDGTTIRMYYRSDGNLWDDLPTTEEFKINTTTIK